MRQRILWVVFVAFASVGISAQPARYDLVVRGGLVIDGTGASGRSADVAVKDGKIVAVGRVAAGAGAREIDARGFVVAPGFIDVHTHADEIAERPKAENFIRMGVTTVVAGNCGGSPADLGPALKAIEASPIAINFATLVGHNDVREAVMGRERRAPTSDELDKMKALVAAAMTDGALGLSSGLEYVPGVYADAAEIVELAKVVGRAGGIYATHMRNEGTEVEKAVAESIRHRRAGRLSRPDLAPQDRQPEPVGIEREDPRPHRPGARTRRPGQRRPVRLHRLQLGDVDPVPRLGARGRAREGPRASFGRGDLGQDPDRHEGDTRRAGVRGPLVRDGGQLPGRPVVQRADDCRDRPEGPGRRRLRGPARDGPPDPARRRRPDGLPRHVRGGPEADHAPPAGVGRIR